MWCHVQVVFSNKPFCHDIGTQQEWDFLSCDFNMSHRLARPKCHAPAHDWVTWDWSTSSSVAAGFPEFAPLFVEADPLLM